MENKKRTVKFTDANNHRWTIEAEITHRNGYPEFIMLGELGQCQDEINPDGKNQKKLIEIWNTWHLNGMHAGTEKQEKALEKYKEENDYEKRCKYLNSINHNGNPITEKEKVIINKELNDLLDEAINLKNNFDSFEKIVNNYYKKNKSSLIVNLKEIGLNGELVEIKNKEEIKDFIKKTNNYFLDKSEKQQQKINKTKLKTLLYDIHPETGKPYKYGTEWIRKDLPKNFWDDIEELFDKIEYEEKNKFSSKKVSKCSKEELQNYDGHIVTLGLHLDLTIDELYNIDQKKYGYGNGNYLYDVYGTEYYCGNQEEIFEAVQEYISDSLWAFNTSFLENYGVLKDIDYVSDILDPLQEKCEYGNEAIKALVQWDENKDEITQDAINADGVGNFLNSYDGTSEYYEVLGEKYIVCRAS